MTAEDTRTWDELLSKHVRVSHVRRPSTSMWYWNDGNAAAVLWRITGAGEGRKDRCHALVGPAQLLDTAAAVALNEWPRWDDDAWLPRDGRLAPVSRYDIENLPEVPSGKSYSADCVDAVYEFLTKPTQPLSLITDRGANPTLYLLSDLLAILCPLVGNDLLTFSTFEVRHDSGVNDLPWLVFLPHDHEPTFNYTIARNVIELQSAVPASKKKSQEDAARTIVSKYLNVGRHQFRRWLDSFDLPAGANTSMRVAELLKRLRRASHDSPTASHQPATVTDQSPTDSQLVETLRTGSSEVRSAALAEIRKRRTAGERERSAILQMLLKSPQWTNSWRAVPTDELDALLTFATRASDWSDPGFVHVINGAIGMQTSPPQLSAALIRLAVKNKSRLLVVSGIAMKHLRELGHPEEDLVGPRPEPLRSEQGNTEVRPLTRQPTPVPTARGVITRVRGSSRPAPRLRMANSLTLLVVVAVVVFIIVVSLIITV